jgi:hypothetical protein
VGLRLAAPSYLANSGTFLANSGTLHYKIFGGGNYQDGEAIMPKLYLVGILVLIACASFATLPEAQAQAVYCTEHQTTGCDYISFDGDLVIEDNPTSTACQAHGINFGNIYSFAYRFTLSPSVITDALALYVNNHSATRMVSTQSPNFSLNGSSTTSWNFINSYANSNTLTPSSSNLIIVQGIGGAIISSTQTMKIQVGSSINNFLAWSDCNIASVKGAGVRKPE